MANTALHDPDAMVIWFILAIVGGVLSVVGWLRWAS
jgi:hypothetical protein